MKAAIEKSKQIISLSTAIVALTVTFVEKFSATPVPGLARVLPLSLQAAWFVFLISVIASILTVSALIGSLDALDRKSKGLPLTPAQEIAADKTVMGSNIRAPAIVADTAFALGVILTIVTGTQM